MWPCVHTAPANPRILLKPVPHDTGAKRDLRRTIPCPAFREVSIRSHSSVHIQKMNLAAFLIPSSLDAKQALRLRRFGLAALTYAASAGFVAAVSGVGALVGSGAPGNRLGVFLMDLLLYCVGPAGVYPRF